MWFLEIVESALLAIPWIGAAIVGTTIAAYVLAIIGWSVVVLADVLGHDVFPDIELDLPGWWDPEELEEVADG